MLAAGTGLAFATILQTTGDSVGSSSFMAAAPDHRRVEIGATWISPSHQRAAVNAEAKRLLARRVEKKSPVFITTDTRCSDN